MTQAGTRGVFITFEGGEGAGKTTQIPALRAFLETQGVAVTATREPGGTAGAEAIRRLVLEGDAQRWSVGVETLLMTAARLDHVERLIEPALTRGEWVLCDRFLDSTRVYQGIAGGFGCERVDALSRLLFPTTVPDLTLLLDLPAAAGMGRRKAAGGGSRFEEKDAAFHERVRAGFLSLAAAEPERFVVIDADQPLSAITTEITALVASRFAARLTGR